MVSGGAGYPSGSGPGTWSDVGPQKVGVRRVRGSSEGVVNAGESGGWFWIQCVVLRRGTPDHSPHDLLYLSLFGLRHRSSDRADEVVSGLFLS